MLADQEGVESGISQANQIFMPVQAGFADGDAICGNRLRQIERSFQAHLEIAKIAVPGALEWMRSAAMDAPRRLPSKSTRQISGSGFPR